MKLVSVIVPIYNVEQYISATIESVLAQTYPHFELLLIDDGSPDRSVEICQQFSDPRIKLIRQENRGLAGARNTGIRHCQGEYIAFLDSDDLWLPDKLIKHLEHLEQFPQVGVSFSPSELIDNQGNRLGKYLKPKLNQITIPYLLRESPVGNGSAAVIRREVLEEIRFIANVHGTPEDCYFDEQLRRCEDLECWLRVGLLTHWKIEGIPEPLTLYRINPEGLSANLIKQLESWEQVLEKMRSLAPEKIIPWESRARAYILRYLARSAIRLKAGKLAIAFMNRAILTDWRILLEEPRRSILTLVGAYFVWLLPLHKT